MVPIPILILVGICASFSDSVVNSQSVDDCTWHRNSPERQPKNKYLMNTIKGKRYTYTDEASNEKYVYQFGVCTKADVSLTGGSYEYAGALQTPQKSKDHPTVLGKFTRSDYREGLDWLMLEYYEGDQYNHHCKGENRSSVIMITCKHGDSYGTFRMTEEVKNKTSNCYYMFELGIDAACDDNLSSGLSTGSIICIVFLSLVAVYLLFGFLYQRFIKGAQGYEQIPNYGFWRKLGNLASDGCNFVFRTDPLSEPREYRGISGETMPDNQEIPRDSDRDDQLLNM